MSVDGWAPGVEATVKGDLGHVVILWTSGELGSRSVMIEGFGGASMLVSVTGDVSAECSCEVGTITCVR